MKNIVLITVTAVIGASLMTVFFFPLCVMAIGTSSISINFCVPPFQWLVPVLAIIGSQGGAPGIFGAIWIEYFIGLFGLLTFLTWLRHKRSN